MTKSLAEIGVLVTRPAPQADTLCRMLEQANGHAYHLPALAILAPEDETKARHSLAELEDYQYVIFVSANAVRQCYLYRPDIPATGIHYACIGQATAQQFEESFARQADIFPQDGFNSEALLAMPEFQAVKGKNILIIKGAGGREHLAQTLADRGANVGYANLYRRELPADSGQQLREIKAQHKIDVIVFTSGEGINNLLSIQDETTRPWFCQKTWLVIHPRLAEIARQVDCANEIIISDGPSNEQIIQCLQNWVARK